MGLGLGLRLGLSNGGAGGGPGLIFSDDALTEQYFTDDTLADPLFFSGGNQLSVDGNFDDSVVDMDFSYVINSDTSTPSVYITPRRTVNGSFIPAPGQWGNYMARLNYMNGKTPTVIVSRTGNYFGMLAVNGWFSYDRITWTRFDNATPVSSPSTWNFSHNTAFTSDTVYVAYLPIFSGPQIESWLADNEDSGYLYETPSAVAFNAAKYQIAETTLGYPIYAVRITDDTQAPTLGSEKKKAVIVGGSHPSELCGSWNVKGLADFLISSDTAAINLRKEFEFWICFDTTPESGAKGKLRYTFEEDVDPNRNIPGSGSGHEVFAVTNAIQSDYGATGPINTGIDFHGGIITLYYGFFQVNEPEATDFFTTLDGYVPTTLTNSGGFIDETMAGFFGTVMQAKYYASLEMGLTAINTIAEMENFGVYVAKTINDLEGVAAAPFNSVAPVISGTPTDGQMLSSTTGTWSGSAPITYAYQWQDDAVDISGATSSTYLLTSAEVGGNITCIVTATNGIGSTDATSNSLGPVASASGFVPTDITGCQLWLDASDTATITDAGAGAVSQWDDKSGEDNHFTQSTSGARPTTGIRTQNSLNVLDFDGGDWMTSGVEVLGTTGLFAAAGQAYTTFVVFDWDANAGFTLGRAVSAQGSRTYGTLTDGTNLLYAARGVQGTIKSSWGGGPAIAVQRWSGTQLSTAYNDEAITSRSVGSATENTGEPIAIGARTTSGTAATFLNGGVCEVIVYDTSLSDAEIGLVLDYINAKWAIY